VDNVPRIEELPMPRLTSLIFLLLAAIAPTAAVAFDIEFTEFTVGDTFPNATLPRTITSGGVDISLSKYNSSISANGRIVDAPVISGANNALFLAANLRAEINLSSPSLGGFFFFRNQGGTNLIEINGQTLDFTNAALAGSGSATLGGVQIHSAPLSSFRSVKLDGRIDTLAFIGQELTIDSVALGLAPPGDFNVDGRVDAADYVVWRKTDGSPAAYTTWRTNFGRTVFSSSSSATLPEPAAIVMISATALVILPNRRSRMKPCKGKIR